MAAAFSEHTLASLVLPTLAALGYGIALLLAALALYGRRMRDCAAQRRQETAA
jgi:uncharacterized membrane protein YhaH (DUF805 family)